MKRLFLLLLFPCIVFAQTTKPPIATGNQDNVARDSIVTHRANIDSLFNIKLGASDTTSLSSRINDKLGASDTNSLSSRINQKLGASDSASMRNYSNEQYFAKSGGALSGSVSTTGYVAASTFMQTNTDSIGSALTAGNRYTYWRNTNGGISAGISSLGVRYMRSIDSYGNVVNLLLSQKDERLWLWSQQHRFDTLDVVSVLQKDGVNVLTADDTSSLTARFNAKIGPSDTLSLSGRIDAKLAGADTLSLSARINARLSADDTTSVRNYSNTLYGSYLTGAGEPSSGLGKNGDIYWDSTNLYFWRKVGSTWRQEP